MSNVTQTHGQEGPPALSSSSPAVAADNPIKGEPSEQEEDDAIESGQHRRTSRPLAAADLLSLWRRSAASGGLPGLGSLTIGSVVFAPCRVQTPARTVARTQPPAYRLHYALAEVTGLQVMAGTVTVSFLCTEPGVDDEAVSLYECIPCPPACLTRWLQEEGEEEEEQVGARDSCAHEGRGVADLAAGSSSACSLLERLLHVAPHEAPLPVNDIYRAMLSSAGRAADTTTEPALRLSAAQQRCAARLRAVYCLSDEEEDDDELRKTTAATATGGTSCQDSISTARPAPDADVDGQGEVAVTEIITWEGCSEFAIASASCSTATATAALTAHYTAPASLHVFFARVFQAVNSAMERLCQASDPATTAPRAWRRPPSHRGAASRAPTTLLVLFDSYAALRRFHIYMTARGHVVQLLDGTGGRVSVGGCSASNNERHSSTPSLLSPPASQTGSQVEYEEVCGGGPPPAPRVRHAFGATCKVWQCMLRDDTGEGEATGVEAEALMDQQVRQLLAAAHPMGGLVSIREQDAWDAEAATAEGTLLRLLPHLRSAHLACRLRGLPSASQRAGPHTAATQGAAAVVKVSGAIFGHRKLLVPCSPEQLTLLASVLASDPPPPSSPTLPRAAAAHTTVEGETARRGGGAGHKRPRSPTAATTAAAAAVEALTPALLERIALGSFTDTAAAALFDAFADAAAVLTAPSTGGVPQLPASALSSRGVGAPPTVLGTVEDVYEKWCVDPSRFGEAFPVFQAVYALVTDVFHHAALFRRGGGLQGGVPSPLPRVALVLPRGNPTHHPSLSTHQFLRTLRLFFAPWTLHEVSSTSAAATVAAVSGAPSSLASSAANACVLWHQRGGLLLLFCDEPTTQLGALQDDADVVVACGKAAAAWVAANAAHDAGSAAASAVYFAVISEMEVVAAADYAAHLWLPSTLRAPAPCLEPQAVAASPTTGLRWPADGAGSSSSSSSSDVHAEVELAQVWGRLMDTIGADGNPVLFTPAPAAALPPPSTRAPQAQPSVSAVTSAAAATASAASARRLRHAAVLPRTLRQAVVLWRHLGTHRENAAPSTVEGKGDVKKEEEKGEQDAETRVDTPWKLLRGVVKSIALACATATPVRMTDVALVHRSNGMSQ